MSKEMKIMGNDDAIRQQETDMVKEFNKLVDQLLTFIMGEYSEHIEFKVFDRGCPSKVTKPTEKKVRQELGITDKNGALFHSAVYVFYYPTEGKYLKIGEVGGNSFARFFNQHYNPNSARSTLAKSIIESGEFRTKENETVCSTNVNNWMKESLQRIDIIFTKSNNRFVSKLVESYLHFILQPRFEG